MYKVTAQGGTKEWFTFEMALVDAITRGYSGNWTLEYTMEVPE